ncbi:MAG: tellurite resistance TerB C-terminal domain-containing protein [Leptolyngbya sp. BL-A-14]
MVKQRLFLGSVAFGLSFGISFLTGRDLGRAIASGATTAVVSVAAAAVVDRQYYQQAHTRIADLKSHIHALQQRRAEAYQAYMQLEAEREQLAASFQTLAFEPHQSQFPPQPQFGSVQLPRALPAARKALSWDLSASAQVEPSIVVKPYDLPTEIPAERQSPWNQSEGGPSEGATPQQVFSEATATKQKIEASLAALQAELSQIKGQITDHRQTREKLSRDVANIREEKRQLEATAKTLKGEVEELETCRVELEQFLTDAEAKKRELETGSNPLQEAFKQLQTQVVALQEELRVLEAQILDRRSQKEALEQQLAMLAAVPLDAQGALQLELNGQQRSDNTATNGNGKNAKTNDPMAIALQTERSKPTPPSKQPVLSRKPAVITKPTDEPSLSRSTQAGTATLPSKAVTADPATDLPQEWADLIMQLPEYELQALKVIAEQNNPAAALKQLAEDNLTMPELLIDSINEHALETIGDLLIDANAGAGSATIVREHLKQVKKILRTYDNLAH